VGDGRCGSHSILIEDSEVRNGHGLSLGSDGVGGVRNVTFRNVFVNGDGPQGSRGSGFHGTTRGAVIFVKRDHGGQWRDLTWANISGVSVLQGISLHEDHSNKHGDPPWPLPLPLPLGKGAGPGGPPEFCNILFEDFDMRNVTGVSSPNWAVLASTVINLTLRRVHLRPTAAGGSSLGWACVTAGGGEGNGSTGFMTRNVFYCEGCTAEDVSPPLVGKVRSRGGGEATYDCSFRSGDAPRGPGRPAPEQGTTDGNELEPTGGRSEGLGRADLAAVHQSEAPALKVDDNVVIQSAAAGPGGLRQAASRRAEAPPPGPPLNPSVDRGPFSRGRWQLFSRR
jgi:hypothetical protein